MYRSNDRSPSFPSHRTAAHALLALGLLISGTAMPAAAQDPEPGDVIRVTTGGPERVYRFEAVRGDTLVLADRGGMVLEIPVGSVTGLEVGTPMHRWETILLKAGIGGAVAGGLGLLFGSMVVQEERFIMPDTYGDEGLVYGLIGGAAIGLVFGLTTDSFRWRDYPVYLLAPK